jgi:hypothetical protein
MRLGEGTMNLPVNGVLSTSVGVLLWRSLVGTAGATTTMHQTTGIIIYMVVPTITGTRSQEEDPSHTSGRIITAADTSTRRTRN